MTLNLFPGGFSIEGHHEGHPFDHTLKAFLRSLGAPSAPGKRRCIPSARHGAL